MDACTTARLLGTKRDIDEYLTSGGKGVALDFLSLYGTMANGNKGVGSWNWTYNKRFINDALANGISILLVTDPAAPLYERGNVYRREVRYLRAKGFGWRRVDDCWQLIRVRP